MTRLDGAVVVRGAGYSLCWVVPATAAAAYAQAHHIGALKALMFLLTLMGFSFGGYAAARMRDDLKLQHAAAAAALCCVVVEGALLLYKLVRGQPVNVPSLILSTLLAACLGVIGGLVGSRDLEAWKQGGRR